MQLVLFNENRCPGVNGNSMPVVVVFHPVFVNDDNGPVPPAQRTPAVVVIVP